MASSNTDPLLPPFDARLFEPPSWATDPVHAGMHKGKGKGKAADGTASDPEGPESSPAAAAADESQTEGDGATEPDDGGGVRFTTPELQKLVTEAEKLKAAGNKHFTAKPQRVDEAKRAYLDAVARLPAVPAGNVPASTEAAAGARIVELEDEEREDAYARIRACGMASWGNLGAVYAVTGEHKEVVEACTKALEFDPKYIKALQRRAAANEAIGSWSSLTAAQEDYTKLISILPRSSPQLGLAQRALAQLPRRIATQQEKEKDEMLGKLKELGNGLLGKFGLSTDMFKFDQQEGGGYNVRFGK